ncbi:hypothetical protein D3C78_1239460 [compost metagenome]
MAGHGGRDIFQLVGKRGGGVPFGDLVGKLTHQPLHIDLTQHGRRFPDGDRARPETFDDEPQRIEPGGMIHQPVAILFRQIDDFRDEQHLRRWTPGMQCIAHFLKHQPLMRGMLVDDDKAVLRLGDDVVLVQLRPRGAERVKHRFRRGARGGLVNLPRLGPRRRHGDVGKARLHRLGKLHVPGNRKRPRR